MTCIPMDDLFLFEVHRGYRFGLLHRSGSRCFFLLQTRLKWMENVKARVGPSWRAGEYPKNGAPRTSWRFCYLAMLAWHVIHCCFPWDGAVGVRCATQRSNVHVASLVRESRGGSLHGLDSVCLSTG